MQLTERIHLVGSGSLGFDLTDPFDCHVYLLDGGDELALIDVGAGMGLPMILEHALANGFESKRIGQVLFTHAHADHAGGAAEARRLLPKAEFLADPETARRLREADSEAIGLELAKRAGFYPPEYSFSACEVERELDDGEVVVVGDLRLTVLKTPGHCDGHVSLLLDDGARRVLFAGDAVFAGGHIQMQNVPDCDLQKQITTLRNLRDLEVTALLSGHLAISLSQGQRHIEKANDALDRLLIPNQLVSAW